MDELIRGHRVPLLVFITTFLCSSFIAHAHDFGNEKSPTAVLAQPVSISATKKNLESIELAPIKPIEKTDIDSETKVDSKKTKETTKKTSEKAKAPIRLTIPEIKLNSRVIALGKDKLGNMDVPSGDTTDVGWYKYGPVPGEVGTAVLDAHVFAAFEKLDQIRVGDYIYTEMDGGEKLKFRVEKTQVYKLSELHPDTLFGSRGYRGLNLITCAGELTPDRSTYTHRLIVFTKLVS